MKKPNKEDFGYINGVFPTQNDKIKYDLAKTLYLSAKRKENKDKLIDDILDMFQGDICNYEEVMLDLCKEALKTRTQKQLKTWL